MFELGIAKENLKCYIITAYEADTKHFENDLMTRREDEK